MKKIFFALVCMLMLCPALVLAAWTDDFQNDFKDYGLETAVENAIGNDITPEAILSFVMSNQEVFSTKNTLKSIYCTGADRDVIVETTEKLGIEATMRTQALEESIAECGQRLVLDDRDNSGVLAGRLRPTPVPPGSTPIPPGPTPKPPAHRPPGSSSPSTP